MNFSGKATGHGQRLRVPEQVQEAPAPQASGGTAVLPTGRIPEEDVDFNPSTGHAHTGTDSTAIGHANLTGVTANQHHTQNHNLLSADHPDSTAASPTRGDIVTAQGASPKWARLAKGSSGDVLTMGANEPGWSAPSVATGEIPVGWWYHTNVSGINTAAADELNNSQAAGTLMAEAAPRTGNLSLLVLSFSGAPGAGGGNSLLVSLYKNGSVAGFFQITVNTNTQYWVQTGSVAVTAGDAISVYAQRTGSLNAVLMSAKVYQN